MNKKLFLRKSSDHIKSFSKSLKSEFGFDTEATGSLQNACLNLLRLFEKDFTME